MKIFHGTFPGHCVGGHVIVFAPTMAEARVLAIIEIEKLGMSDDRSELHDLKELKQAPARAIVIDDGNY